MTDPNQSANRSLIVNTSIEDNAERDPGAALTHDDKRWIEAVLEGLDQRSNEVKQEFLRLMVDGQPPRPGSMPLLGLELTDAENSAENGEPSEDSNRQDLLAPLLGTIISNDVENVRQSSSGRSSSSICYGHLLQNGRRTSGRNIGKRVNPRQADCYLA